MANRVFFASDKSLALAVDHTVYRYGTTLEYVDASHIKVKGNKYLRIDQSLVVIDTDTTIGWECLDTVSPEASKTYHVYVCIQSGNNEPLFRISLSDSAPSGFDTTTSREIGTFQTDSSGDIDANSITGPTGGWIPKAHGNEAHNPDMLPLDTSSAIDAYMSGNKWLSVATSGIVGLPKQSACAVKLGSNVSVSHDTDVLVPFNSILIDTQSEWDSSNHRFTASEDGIYLVSAELAFVENAEAYIQVDIRKNGAKLHVARFRNWAIQVWRAFVITTWLVSLDAGDYIDFITYQYNYTDGTALTINASYSGGFIMKVA